MNRMELLEKIKLKMIEVQESIEKYGVYNGDIEGFIDEVAEGIREEIRLQIERKKQEEEAKKTVQDQYIEHEQTSLGHSSALFGAMGFMGGI